MGARRDLRYVHDSQQSRARSSHFTRIQRPVRYHTTDGATDFRITKLRRRAVVLALRRFQLAFRRFERLLLAYSMQRLQVLLCDFILIVRIGQVNTRLIEFFARQRALREQIFASVINLLRCIELRLLA